MQTYCLVCCSIIQESVPLGTEKISNYQITKSHIEYAMFIYLANSICLWMMEELSGTAHNDCCWFGVVKTVVVNTIMSRKIESIGEPYN